MVVGHSRGLGLTRLLPPTRSQLEAAALEHAVIPREVRADRSPLVRYVPDHQRVSAEILDLVEQITDRRCPWGGAIADYVMAAWCRATLNRWALRQTGIAEARRDAEARHLRRRLAHPQR